ncbi:MAG TPA: hypothetical protein PLN56_09630 [Methanoregulaceae archaeon]|nr:hypothetical protein [Methanoregulaceae archaeon]
MMVSERILRSLGIPTPVREFRFDPKRRWRVDLCWPEHKLAVEIEGGVYLYGRHNRAVSFVKDMEKYNALTLAGYSLLRFTPTQVRTGEAWLVVREWFDRYSRSDVCRCSLTL